MESNRELTREELCERVAELEHALARLRGLQTGDAEERRWWSLPQASKSQTPCSRDSGGGTEGQVCSTQLAPLPIRASFPDVRRRKHPSSSLPSRDAGALSVDPSAPPTRFLCTPEMTPHPPPNHDAAGASGKEVAGWDDPHSVWHCVGETRQIVDVFSPDTSPVSAAPCDQTRTHTPHMESRETAEGQEVLASGGDPACFQPPAPAYVERGSRVGGGGFLYEPHTPSANTLQEMWEDDDFPRIPLSRYETTLKKLWAENRAMARGPPARTVLLYAIPQRNRMGGKNKQWAACKLVAAVVTSAGGAQKERGGTDGSSAKWEWHEFPMEALMSDPLDGDRIFRVEMDFPGPSDEMEPRGGSGAHTVAFYVEESGVTSPRAGRDHPCAHWGDEEMRRGEGGNYYRIPKEWQGRVVSLRDGELADCDRIFQAGIRIRFEGGDFEEMIGDGGDACFSSSFTPDVGFGLCGGGSESFGCSDDWFSSSIVLRWLDENDGTWRDRPFVRVPAGGGGWVFEVTLLEVKSASFVVQQKGPQGEKWVKAADGSNFRIKWPGAYALYANGQLFECAEPAVVGAPSTLCSRFGPLSTGRGRATGVKGTPVYMEGVHRAVVPGNFDFEKASAGRVVERMTKGDGAGPNALAWGVSGSASMSTQVSIQGAGGNGADAGGNGKSSSSSLTLVGTTTTADEAPPCCPPSPRGSLQTRRGTSTAVQCFDIGRDPETPILSSSFLATMEGDGDRGAGGIARVEEGACVGECLDKQAMLKDDTQQVPPPLCLKE
uniref:Uncharacterized protein n=1 Tax=Chromera velia CCMP2878 TaxID=1169474 RepID=A0A0G4FL44_9ALVE|eukprot:Cvel_17546.t1-p1 / transcript=Cvel_17546.t1 / gene=Cvel_17546 / organism=Chromera_velia_CCMP2878 / gene_product=hypothetical protein / transcript_product=hypothetical protein / location=Cvel_scaffold1408:37188-40469(+) / protein_length=774 / sequence_SO=supercontig / SO=protein_coding / is_pseudo=false